MAPSFKKAAHFSSHFPSLIHSINNTTGPVVEFGTGLFSTPLIHYMCIPNNRLVVSLENDARYLDIAKSFEHPLHQVMLIEDWDSFDVNQHEWGVGFIDHGPAERRKVDVARLANIAKVIVIHDTNGRQNRHYHYDEIWGLFKYFKNDGKQFPQTTIVSNFIDVRQWNY